MTPFLSIITRTYKRPVALARCKALLQAQVDHDFEHIVAEDKIGLGVIEAYRLFLDVQPAGEFVAILDDDNFVASPYFVSDLRAAARAYDPDVIVFKENNAQLGILPDRFVWQQQPRTGHISGSDVAVRRRVWEACIGAIMTDGQGGGPVYEGDYHYLVAVWAHTSKIHWMDKVQIIVPHIGRGDTEAERLPHWEGEL